MVFAKKSYGQHFLKDRSVIEKIIAAAEITADEEVVEVGPGTGALTDFLPKENLVLIEADQDLIPELQERFPQAKIITEDAARVDFSKLIKGRDWVFVSNLPYNAGNAIIMNVLQAEHSPRCLVVMVQKEVGERILGISGAESVLTVAIQMYATVEKVCKVPPGAFSPPPKVDSVVLKLTPLKKKGNEEAVIALAKIGFANRRKQLHRNLAEAGLGTSEELKKLLSFLKLSPLARAEDLTRDDWIKLAEHLSPKIELNKA